MKCCASKAERTVYIQKSYYTYDNVCWQLCRCYGSMLINLSTAFLTVVCINYLWFSIVYVYSYLFVWCLLFCFCWLVFCLEWACTYIFAGCSVVNDSEVSFPVYHTSQLHYRARDDASLIVIRGDRLQQQQQRALHLPFEWSRIDIMRMSPMLWAEPNSFCVPPARPTSLNAHLVADCVRVLGGRTLCGCVTRPA